MADCSVEDNRDVAANIRRPTRGLRVTPSAYPMPAPKTSARCAPTGPGLPDPRARDPGNAGDTRRWMTSAPSHQWGDALPGRIDEPFDVAGTAPVRSPAKRAARLIAGARGLGADFAEGRALDAGEDPERDLRLHQHQLSL
jgi:hypothetical protein